MDSAGEPAGELVAAVRAGLAELADARLADRMRTYMKSEMAFRGVPLPPRKRMLKQLFAEHPLPDRAAWLSAVLALWREATFREERYCAISLAGHPVYARWRTVDLLPVYEELIVTGAWWDYVDDLAIRHVGPLLAQQRAVVTPIMLAWAGDDSRWKRRTSVICQIKAKADTDLALLTACVETCADDPDFFLRKGIGWALREYAKTDPAWVREFLLAHPNLSPLSTREAAKHL